MVNSDGGDYHFSFRQMMISPEVLFLDRVYIVLYIYLISSNTYFDDPSLLRLLLNGIVLTPGMFTWIPPFINVEFFSTSTY